MKKKLFLFLIVTWLLMLSLPAVAQVSSNTAYRIRKGSSLPAACNPGDVFFEIGVAGYLCTAANTWSILDSGGGSGIVGAGVAGELAVYTAGNTVEGAVGVNWAVGGITTTIPITVGAASVLFTGTQSADSNSVQVALLQGDRATVAVNDEAYASLRLSNDGGTQVETARITWAIPDPTAGAVYGRLDFSVMGNNVLAKELQLSSDDLAPSTADGLALGTLSLPFSDLFLASGGIIDWNNGNVTLTHSAGLLTLNSALSVGGNILSVGTTQGALGTPANGTIIYCSDCTVTDGSDNTCAGSGSGALAVRLNGVWRCFAAQN